MYCPACGVKNEPGVLRCFICKETMPTGRAPEKASPGRPSRPTAASAAVSIEILGSAGDRMIALVLDRILLAAILLIPAAALGGYWNQLQSGPLLAGVSGLGVLLVIFLYHVVFEAFLETTPGKAILGLYVRNESDRPNIAAMAIRNLVRIADSLALYLVGFLSILFSPRKQRLGDLAARTVVLERRIGWGARIALILMWIAILVASVWLADAICPDCTRNVREAIALPKIR